MAVHRKNVGIDLVKDAILASIKQLPRQAVAKKIAGVVEEAGARKFCQATKKTGLERFLYRRAFCEDKAVECFWLKGPERTADQIPG